MKHILLPTDFSVNSTNALIYALALAKSFHTDITIFHVFRADEPPLNHPYSTPSLGNLNLNKAIEFTIKESVFDLIYHIDPGFFTSDRIFYKAGAGDPVAEIHKEVSGGEFDLVILGTKGSNYRSEERMGSVTARLLEKCSVPVLAIPQDAKYQKISTLGLLDDLGRLDKKDIELLENFRKYFNARLVMAHLSSGEEVMAEYQAKNYRESILKLADFSEFELKMLLIEDVFDAIESFVTDVSPDILIVLGHNSPLVKSVFKSDTTRELTFHIHTPLLVITH